MLCAVNYRTMENYKNLLEVVEKSNEEISWYLYQTEDMPNTVEDYIDRKISIMEKESPNLLKEIDSYSRKKDKDGVVLDAPVKFMDHLMDCLRYAVYTYVEKIIQIKGISKDMETIKPYKAPEILTPWDKEINLNDIERHF